MIDLEILSFEGFIFMLVSGIIIYGLIRFSPLLDFFGYEKEISSEADLTREGTLFSSSSLYSAGVSSLLFLNVLILVLNCFDLSFLVMGAHLPEDLTWSELVHQGIGSLITSLILAILILFFFIRGAVYRHPKYRILLLLAGIWILQNCLMVIFNFWKNHLYIEEFGLTGKRIGVDVYLLLAITGLVVSWLQIYRKKSTLFTLQNFGFTTWLFLVSASLVNWPVVIAKYNLSRTYDGNKPLDLYYLYELGDNVLPMIIEYDLRIPPDKSINNSYSYSNDVYDLNYRTNELISQYENTSWRSKNFSMERTYMKLKRSVD